MTTHFKVSFTNKSAFERLPASIRQDNPFTLGIVCDTVTEAATRMARIAADAGTEFDKVLVHMVGQESEHAIYRVDRATATAAVNLELVSGRGRAYPFDNEEQVRLAIMEARGADGICAHEPAGAFSHHRLEGETVFYVTVQTEDNGMLYITRGRRT